MEFGLVAQLNPPASEVVALAQRAETAGFSHFWAFDSHVLWQEPFVIFSQILSNTERVKVGPMVTNPLTRDWTVTASLFATLNDMFGARTVCGIGRGDSAVRVTGGTPASLTTLGEAMGVIKELAEGPPRARVALKVLEGAPAREGAEIADASGKVIGAVTSGGFSPVLKCGIAIGFVTGGKPEIGAKLKVIVRGKPQSAEVVASPFVPHRYVRKI